MKYINFKRYKFSTVTKYISYATGSIKKILKTADIIFKKIDIKRINLRKLTRYLNFKNYDSVKISKHIDLKKYVYLSFLFIIFVCFLYVFIPTFFTYEKKIIQKVICNNEVLDCSINGKIKYRFYPNPRIVIQDLKINYLSENKNSLLIAEQAAVKLSLKNLINKKKQIFKKLEINNYDININLKKYQKYKALLIKKNFLIPIIFSKGNIIFFDDNKYVATISKSNVKFKFEDKIKKFLVRGNFLGSDLFFSWSNKKKENKLKSDIVFKLSDFNILIKSDYISLKDGKEIIDGNILIKKNKNKITSIFDYKDDKIYIKKSNLRNTLIDGKMEGIIKLIPYFTFDLDINLNSINFTKLYNYFLSLEKNKQKAIFKINNKINGKLSLSSEKIYSNYNLVQSFESRFNFNNGNIFIEQMLLNLDKLGAADLIGEINNDKDVSNLKFESNVFVDNQKKFLSKFGIYNKDNISTNLYFSGNFDLEKPRASFYEISDTKKLSNEDINFVEKEFNNILLEEGFETLFIFPNFKKFVKSITSN